MGAVEELLKFIADLNAKKLFGLLLALALSSIALVIFEKQTSWFALSKLERREKLVAEIVRLERDPPTDPETRALIRRLKDDLIRLSPPLVVAGTGQPHQVTVTPSPPARALWLSFFAGAFPWSLLCIGPLVHLLERKRGSGSELLGIGVVTVAMGTVNIFVAVTPYSTLNYFAIPWAVFLFTGGVAVVVAAAKSVRRVTREKVITNNLRQLRAAMNQHFLEHGVKEARYDDLVGPDKYIRGLPNVAGENYSGLPFELGVSNWTVVTSDGQTVSFEL